MIKLYKTGDTMAIMTDCGDERTFLQEISAMFAQLIDEKRYEDDWTFQFTIWLEQIVDICCKYRGYKNTVREERLLIAGEGYPSAPLVATYDERGENNGSCFGQDESEASVSVVSHAAEYGPKPINTKKEKKATEKKK